MTGVATEIQAKASAKAITAYRSAIASTRRRFDDAIVRYDAWFLVFVAVLLALGFTLVAGAAVWCMTKGGGRRFAGGMHWKNGFSISLECR